MGYEYNIAYRYILPRKKHFFTSLISIISLIGIIVGVWALIVVMSVMNGFRAELLDRILGMNGHLIVQDIREKGFSDPEAFIHKIENIKGVKYALPVNESQALVQGAYGRGTGALVRGIQEQDLKKIRAVYNNIKQGNLKGFGDQDDVIIGTGMAKNLGLRVGDDLRIVTPEGDVTPFGVNPRIKNYRVKAIFEVGMFEYDSSIVFMPLKEAQAFFNLSDKVKNIEVFLNNPDDVERIRSQLPRLTNDMLYTIDWRERNKTFFSALQIERNVMFIILSLIILVAALNIASSLIMLVKDKTADIAILRTMGATRASVRKIFWIAGTSISCLGIFLGSILAILTCLNIENIQKFVSWLFNVDVFNPQLYFLAKLPAKIDPVEVYFVIFITLVLSFLATWIPAWRASRLDPVTALRYE